MNEGNFDCDPMSNDSKDLFQEMHFNVMQASVNSLDQAQLPVVISNFDR
ncbi:MAG: hypothetical protein ACMG6E_08330 [Candidatus Roizmanbacteria bacterium]